MDAATRIDRLYRLPPDEFITARDELVRELRAGGEKEAAAEVKALRRSTVAAWALNQAARQRRELVEALVNLGQELREAQEVALSSGDASGLRAATAKRRELVGELTSTAMGVLSREGRDSRAQAPAIGAILEAVVTNPAVAELLSQGRLVSEPEPAEIDLAGFGADLEFVPPKPKPARQRTQTGRGLRLTGPAPPEPAEEPDVRVARRKAVGSAQWNHERAVRAATDAAAALDAAAARAANATADRHQAEQRLEAAIKTQAASETRLAAASRTHEAAQEEVHRTAAELETARRALEERSDG